MKRKEFFLLTVAILLGSLLVQTAAAPPFVAVTIRIEARPYDDPCAREHGLTIDTPLHGDFWNYPNEVFTLTNPGQPLIHERVVAMPCGPHYVEYAASGWGITPVSPGPKTYPWEAWIFVDGVEIAYGNDIGRDNFLHGDFVIPCPGGIPLFSDILSILPLGIVAGTIVIKRRRT